MPEWRVPKVVRQGDRLRQLGRQARRKALFLCQHIVRNASGDLGRFDAVSQARAIKIGLADAEDLRLSLQAAERRAVQDAVPVALGRMTVVAWSRRRLGMTSLEKERFHGHESETNDKDTAKTFKIAKASCFAVFEVFVVPTAYPAYSEIIDPGQLGPQVVECFLRRVRHPDQLEILQ
jgi:hypothetical protein